MIDKNERWHQCNLPFFPRRTIDGRWTSDCGQVWRRKINGKWEYKQDEEYAALHGISYPRRS
jgi:hypothetical protein